jgi:hypothetical protein
VQIFICYGELYIMMLNKKDQMGFSPVWQSLKLSVISTATLTIVTITYEWNTIWIIKALLLFHNDAHNHKITVEKGVHFSTVYRTPAQQACTLPWHWPRHEQRGYRIITVVLAKHKNGSLTMVPTWTETCRSNRRNF